MKRDKLPASLRRRLDRRRADDAGDEYAEAGRLITYGLACRCGHRAVIRMTEDDAHAARFKCSKCGRTQTR